MRLFNQTEEDKVLVETLAMLVQRLKVTSLQSARRFVYFTLLLLIARKKMSRFIDQHLRPFEPRFVTPHPP